MLICIWPCFSEIEEIIDINMDHDTEVKRLEEEKSCIARERDAAKDQLAKLQTDDDTAVKMMKKR